MPAPNLGGDGKEEVVGEEALSELSLSQGDQFSVSDLESLVTLQAELDRLHHGDPSSEAQIEIEEEVIKEEEVQEEEEVHEEEILEIQEEEIHEVHEGDIQEGDIHEVIVEEIVTDETDGLETEIISEEVSINEVEIEEEDVSDNSVIISGLNEDVEEVEVQIDELQENDVEKSEDKSPSDSKSEDSQVSTQPMNVIKNAFNFPGQIMKVTVSGGQIVSTKMIGQFSPKMQMVNNSNASNSKSSGTGSNVVHLKPVKKVAVQPKPVSFQTVQGFRTITKAGVKRAASTSIDQSRNQSAKMIINSDLTPQPVQHVLLTSETTTSKTVPITTPSQNIKVVTGVSLPQSIAASPNKSITLVQAKQAGLLGPGKLQQIIPSSPQKSIVVNKIGTSPKKVTLMKSPSKILPAPGPQAKGKIAMQKIFLRQGNALKPATFLAPGQQVIRLQNPQNMVPSGVSNVGTLHQIQLPGSKQVQLVRVVGAGNSTATLVPNSSVNQTTVVSVTTALSTASPSEVKTFPVTILPAPSTSISPTSSNSSGSNILTINASSSSNITTVSSSTSIGSKPPLRPKIVSIAPARSTGSGSLLYTVPSPSGTVTPVSSGKSVNVVMLPTQYIQQVQQDSKSNLNAVSISSKFEKLDKPEVTKEMLRDIKLEIKTEHDEKPNLKSKGSLITASQANGIRPRKPCNCTRSQCLKLYCDCFASGEFCYQCNCTCCFNNLEHEEDRQLAIKSCLERNPNAFRPKIGRTYATDTERRHTKGCNCKRSGCLKNYCECYESVCTITSGYTESCAMSNSSSSKVKKKKRIMERSRDIMQMANGAVAAICCGFQAKIPCSHNCKCVGCRNIEDGPIAIRRHREELREEMAAQSLTTLATIADDLSSTSCPGQPSKLSMNMFSTDVLEATVQCLLAQALEAQDKGLDKVKSQQLLLEEYGRCLKNIIEFSSMNQDLT